MQGKVKSWLTILLSHATCSVHIPEPQNAAATSDQKLVVPACPMYSRWPPFSCGDSEKCQQSPQHVVVMELVFFPFSGLRLHLIFFIVKVLTPRNNRDSVQMGELNQISRAITQ